MLQQPSGVGGHELSEGLAVEAVGTEPEKADVDRLLVSLLDGEDIGADGLSALLEYGPVAVLGTAANLAGLERNGDTVLYGVYEAPPTPLTLAELRDSAVQERLIRESAAGELPCLHIAVGALDTVSERVSALLTLKELLARCPQTVALAPVPIAGPTAVDYTATDALRFAALARLVLDIPFLAAPRGDFHMDVLQARLRMGSNAVLPIAEDAVEDVERHIREAGFTAIPCDAHLQPIGTARTDGAAIFRRQPWARIAPLDDARTIVR